MADPIFARPRHLYDSYRDLITLIEVSGFPLIYFDEIDPASDNTYIMTLVNGENQNGWPDTLTGQARARIILLDLEWRLQGEYPRIPGVREIWACDRWYAGRIGAKYFPMGSHPCLNMEPGKAPDNFQYDVTMLAYMVWRRQIIQGQLVGRGLTVAPNGLSLRRHEILSHSAVMLHCHQYDNVATVAPLRFALAAAYKLPLVAEQATDCGLTNGPILYTPYAGLAEAAHKARGDAAWRQDAGAALYEKWCVEWPFRRSIESVL